MADDQAWPPIGDLKCRRLARLRFVPGGWHRRFYPRVVPPQNGNLGWYLKAPTSPPESPTFTAFWRRAAAAPLRRSCREEIRGAGRRARGPHLDVAHLTAVVEAAKAHVAVRERLVVRGQDRLSRRVQIENGHGAALGVTHDAQLFPNVAAPVVASRKRRRDGFAIGIAHDQDVVRHAVVRRRDM